VANSEVILIYIVAALHFVTFPLNQQRIVSSIIAHDTLRVARVVKKSSKLRGMFLTVLKHNYPCSSNKTTEQLTHMPCRLSEQTVYGRTSYSL